MSLVGFWGFDDNIAEVGIASAAVIAGRSATGRATNRGATSLADMVTFAAQTSFFFGCAVLWSSSFAAGAFLAFVDSGGTVHLRLRTTAAGGIELYGPANTLVASSPAGILVGSNWQSVQGAISIADSGGTVEIKVDNAVVLTYTGDTRNAGVGNVVTIQNASPAGNTGFDDVWVTNSAGSAPYNTYLGDCVVRPVLPNNNGDSSQWTGSDGNSVDNYLLVDDPGTAVNTTDYVAASAAGLTDLYQLADIPTSDTVFAYKVLTYAAKSDAGTPPVMKPVTKGATGTVREEAALSLTTTFQLFPSANNITDPDGNALTPARINAMQAGVRSA